jgi:S-adenosylmethionine hydrolase
VARPIVFLSDFGLQDEFVGICHAVIARIAPGCPVVDLSHGIPPQDVLRGALTLADALPYLPADSVILAVVDPGVGTSRLDLAVQTVSGRLMVGPDNGLLSLAWRRLGGADRAVAIDSPDVVLEPVSATFHGRDVFAPAAAHLANGLPLDRLGRSVDLAGLVELSQAIPAVELGRVSCEVLDVDRFGNVQLNARRQALADAGIDRAGRVEVRAAGATVEASAATTFADVPEGAFGLIADARGWLTVVRNRRSAAEGLHIGPGDRVVLTGAVLMAPTGPEANRIG